MGSRLGVNPHDPLHWGPLKAENYRRRDRISQVWVTKAYIGLSWHMVKQMGNPPKVDLRAHGTNLGLICGITSLDEDLYIRAIICHPPMKFSRIQLPPDIRVRLVPGDYTDKIELVNGTPPSLIIRGALTG